VKYFDWSDEKNKELIKKRGISFEEIVFWITHGGLLDILEHPDKARYPNQNIFIVRTEEYVYNCAICRRRTNYISENHNSKSKNDKEVFRRQK